jgi:hypothetical protein
MKVMCASLKTTGDVEFVEFIGFDSDKARAFNRCTNETQADRPVAKFGNTIDQSILIIDSIV